MYKPDVVPSRRLGATLRALREAAEIPRSVLARRIGVDPAALYQLESRGTNPSFLLVVKIARALDLSVEDVADAALGRNTQVNGDLATVKAAQAIDAIGASVERTVAIIARSRASLSEPTKRPARKRTP